MVEKSELFNKILRDINKLCAKDEIKGSELDDFKDTLETKEVKNYIENIGEGSKPEQALRETFFNENSPFIKSLFPNFRIIPELSIKRVGFLDYKLEGYGMNIIIELKPLLEATIKNKILEKVKYIPLDWQREKKQIYKYIREEDYKYAILTDLKKWYFFSKSKVYNEEHIDFIYSVPFGEFINELQKEGNLINYLERIEHLSIKEDLDKKFFDSLKEWISKLREIKFTCNENDKIESIVYLINKFIFIQTLDDYGIIEINKIRKEFTFWEQKYHAKGDYYVLKTFLEEINKEFYLYYDTELFANHQFMDFVDVEDSINLNKLSKVLKYVLGLSAGQTSTRWVNGISNYNFKFIDEDILGKAYETFLAEVRKEQGIYYTPPYITKYISENTVGNIFDEKINNFKEYLEKKDYEKAKNILSEIMQIKVLDPACGSGSFLIKSLRLISKKYQEIKQIFDEQLKKYGKMNGLEHEHLKDYEQIRQIFTLFKTSSKRELLSKILIRHIHGNDLDSKALEVAKVNLWLEAIKLAPQDFKTEVIGHFNNSHVLPNLSMNLGNGDSLIGLPEKETIAFLKNNFQNEIKELSKERNLYLQDTTNTEHMGNILAIKKNIQKKINEEFEKYLIINKLPSEIKNKTIPFHWALEFWYCFFNEDGTPKEQEFRGFDAVIGNPPYDVLIEIKNRPELKDRLTYFSKEEIYKKHLSGGRKNLYWLFIIRGYYLLKSGGGFSYINPSTLLCDETTSGLREILIKKMSLLKIIEFPEKTRVFKDVTQAVVIFNTKKIIEDNDIEVIYNVINTQELPNLRGVLIKKELLERFTSNLSFPLKLEDIILILLKKIHKNKKLEENYIAYQGEANLTFFQDLFTKKVTESILIRGEHVSEPYFTDKYSENDWRYIDWKNFEKRISQEKKQNLKKIRVVTQQVSNMGLIDRLKSSIVLPKEVVGNSCNCIAPKKEEESPLFILAVINSLLMEFRFRLFSTNNHINTYELNDLPIISYDPKSKLIFFAKRMLDLKKDKYFYKNIWQEYSTKYKNNQKLLREILIEDKREIRGGNFRSLWTSESNIYPDENNKILNEEFKEFRILLENKKILKILGVNPNSEKELLKLKFTKKELRDLVYLELITTLESRSRIKTLKNIFDKTTISIINPYPNSINLIKGIENKFKEWAKENKIPKELVSVNLAEINQKVEDTDSEIDANVFKLYELDEEEIKIVMDSLNTPQYYQEKVFNFFKKLK